jgi:hypothetical protein
MDNRFSRWEKSIIGATLIGLIPLGAIAQFPSLGLAQELKKSEQLIKEIQKTSPESIKHLPIKRFI